MQRRSFLSPDVFLYLFFKAFRLRSTSRCAVGAASPEESKKKTPPQKNDASCTVPAWFHPSCSDLGTRLHLLVGDVGQVGAVRRLGGVLRVDVQVLQHDRLREGRLVVDAGTPKANVTRPKKIINKDSKRRFFCCIVLRRLTSPRVCRHRS